MTEEDQRRATQSGVGAGGETGQVERGARRTLWWVIIAVYLALFAATGYAAFFGRDIGPALNPRTDELIAKLSDERTRTVVINTLQQEADEQRRKESLATGAFNIVLGSVLGFLSASAVSKTSGKGRA